MICSDNLPFSVPQELLKYAVEIMKKSRRVYWELVEKADDIGDDNPMAYNELFALAFVAPYVASEKKIPPETVQEMMRRALYHEGGILR